MDVVAPLLVLGGRLIGHLLLLHSGGACVNKAETDGGTTCSDSQPSPKESECFSKCGFPNSSHKRPFLLPITFFPTPPVLMHPLLLSATLLFLLFAVRYRYSYAESGGTSRRRSREVGPSQPGQKLSRAAALFLAGNWLDCPPLFLFDRRLVNRAIERRGGGFRRNPPTKTGRGGSQGKEVLLKLISSAHRPTREGKNCR